MMSKPGSGEFAPKAEVEDFTLPPCPGEEASTGVPIPTTSGAMDVGPSSRSSPGSALQSAGSMGRVGRGHMRSASHGGVAASGLTSSGSTGLVSRPSALKSSRGHQRAFSQGQIEGTSESGGLQRGHSRVGSRTDFILPPGHRDTEGNDAGNRAPGTSAHKAGRGHSRQASRSESIYTLRNNMGVPFQRRMINFILRRPEKTEFERPSFRTIVPNHLVPPKTPPKLHPNGKTVNNRIRTTKYTVLSFLPKNLLEQFHRVANLYFIFIILLNWFPEINAFGKEVAMIPVMFVLGVTAIKDLFEDRRRKASDTRINNSTCRVYVSEAGRYKRLLWRDLRVGDLVHLSNNEVIPADVLLLRSSDPNGMCYIDTCNLDGETNLKPRQVARGFVDKYRTFEPSLFRSKLEVDPPTTKMYRFHGTLVHPSGATVPVGTENLLLRECMLKNTDFVEGIVVYAGHESKAMLNNGGPRYKRSKLERQMNMDIIWCVVILIVLCVVGAVGCRFWLQGYDPEEFIPFIPNLVQRTPSCEGFLAFWTFIIILQIMIPLSLYVSIEMTKLAQVYHIHHNKDLYDPLTDKRIECRALNITEELGQVQYIFSDKTGTLTENRMLFRRCAIGGVDYNHPPPENIETLRLRPGIPIPVSVNPVLLEELAQLSVSHKTKDGVGFSQEMASDFVASQSSNDNAKDAGGAASAALVGRSAHSQKLQEFLLVLAICNTVVVARHPHHDMMNDSGVIESNPVPNLFDPNNSTSVEPIKEETTPTTSKHPHSAGARAGTSSTHPNAPPTGEKFLFHSQENISVSNASTPNVTPQTIYGDKYTRLTESRSVTPSPPPLSARAVSSTPQPIPSKSALNQLKASSVPTPVDSTPVVGFSSLGNASASVPIPSHLQPSPPISRKKKSALRPRLLNVPPFISLSNRRGSSAPALSQGRSTPSMGDLKPIFEAESPDEIALVEAAYSYNCRLVRKSAHYATLFVPGEGLMEFELLQVLPFDSNRKCMSVVIRHPHSREIILYSKGADSTILTLLAPTDDSAMKHMIMRTQQHLNSYAKQGLRVLVMAKRVLSEQFYANWVRTKNEIEIINDHREREKRTRDLYSSMENSLVLLGATGIEDRLQEGVPETIAALLSAGIVLWVLTGDKPETAINVAYSAKLFSPQMELLKISARSKEAAERTIAFYLAEIERDNPPIVINPPLLTGATNVTRMRVGGAGIHPKPNERVDAVPSTQQNARSMPTMSHSAGIRMNRKRALVVDGKSLTYILDKRSKLQKPFLELTRHCSSVLCCRATPLQKAYIVRVVKEQLKMRTLAVGDGANDVSMIQTADIGIGISGQEGMQAVMASDFALSRFKYLERFLLVHGHWCYHRLASMILYFFYKNATFVFLIFWYQLYCGYSGQIMLDDMFLMLFNLMFSSLAPFAIGIYDQDAPEEILLSQPHLYRQGRLGRVYKPHSFWVTMADCLYQSLVVFFVARGAYNDSDVGLWQFGTTVTTSCMFIMLIQAAIEIRSWTIIHLAAILLSLAIYFVFTIVYNSIRIPYIGYSTSYGAVLKAFSSPVHWSVVALSIVTALLPRFVMRSLETRLFPNDVTRALIDWQRARRRDRR